MKNKPLFITGIGTGIGKTVISALFVELMEADYWKPVQSGDLHHTDTDKVKELVSNPRSVFHPETYRLTQPLSPHRSAELDNIQINLDAFELPLSDKPLIIEGAGGLMVPLNQKDLMIDLIKKLNCEVILVSQNYLGSINHTLLSIEALQTRGINIRQVVINGEPNPASEAIIEQYSQVELLRVPLFKQLDKDAISRFAAQLK